MASKVAIVGAGPKAAAIASKAAAVASAGLTAPEITIFEAERPGAAWSGEGGYSDGVSLLCTPAERDVGFPYDEGSFGPDVAKTMLARFSWQAFNLDRGSYADWLNRGRRRPAHLVFAEYLNWVIVNSGCRVVPGKVTAIRYDAATRTWDVDVADGAGPVRGFEGIVVTGSGPALPSLPGARSEVFNGHDFWLRTTEVIRRLAGDEPSVTIIGSGGTAAAVAAWFVRQGHGHLPIRIVGREASLYSRSPGYFESAAFGDDATWDMMTDVNRENFIRRLTAGVVWEDVVDLLATAPGVSYIPGDAQSFEQVGSELALRIAGRYEAVQPASVFVDCRGFDGWWFRDLITPEGAEVVTEWRNRRRGDFDDSLALSGAFPFSGLHVPGLASQCGPAAGNLMALGWMSDRVLRPYVPDQELFRRMRLT